MYRCIDPTSLLLPFRTRLSRAVNHSLRSDNLELYRFFLDIAAQRRRGKLDGVPSSYADERLLRSRDRLELVEIELGFPRRSVGIAKCNNLFCQFLSIFCRGDEELGSENQLCRPSARGMSDSKGISSRKGIAKSSRNDKRTTNGGNGKNRSDRGERSEETSQGSRRVRLNKVAKGDKVRKKEMRD